MLVSPWNLLAKAYYQQILDMFSKYYCHDVALLKLFLCIFSGKRKYCLIVSSFIPFIPIIYLNSSVTSFADHITVTRGTDIIWILNSIFTGKCIQLEFWIRIMIIRSTFTPYLFFSWIKWVLHSDLITTIIDTILSYQLIKCLEFDCPWWK